MSPRHWKLLTEFINLPTAPFVETAPLDFIRRFVAARPPLSGRSDRYGNLLVSYTVGASRRKTRPVLLAGHLDHPGFVSEALLDARTLRASWRGWVRPEFFPNARVRFWNGDMWVRGRVVEVIPATTEGTAPRRRRATASARSFGAESPPAGVVVRTTAEVPVGAPGMWDFPDARRVGRRLHARACDDVVGVAAILCFLDIMCRKKSPARCHAFFTRAEEVGFGGALAACADGGLPRDAIVVAIECSKAIAGVSLGAGPVLRVGDKATVFTPAATAFCQTVAEDLAKANSSFRFQRKLMDGGTCESTVYCHYGYDATGICLPLLNYHNMDLERGRVAAEIIDLDDFENLVAWFEALATTSLTFDGSHPGLDQRLDALLHKHRPTLLATARAVRRDAAGH